MTDSVAAIIQGWHFEFHAPSFCDRLEKRCEFFGMYILLMRISVECNVMSVKLKNANVKIKEKQDMDELAVMPRFVRMFRERPAKHRLLFMPKLEAILEE